MADLPALFEDPLAGVTPLPLRSGVDAQKEIETLKSNLQSKTDWSIKCDAIQRTMRLLKGGALNFPDFDLLELAPGIADSITDLRSTLVRWSTLCAAAAANLLGPRFSNFVDVFVPALFKQTTHGTAIISQCCRLGILQIATHACTRRTLQAILVKADSKSSVHRAIVAECLGVIRNRWPPTTYQTSLPQVKKVLADLKTDRSQEVRELARGVGEFEAGKVRTPSPRKKKQEPKYGTVKELTPPRQKLTFNQLTWSKKAKRDIGVPKNEEEAEIFVDQLELTVAGGTLGKGKIKKEVIEGLPVAIEMLPTHEKWKVIMPRLFEIAPNEMSTLVTTVIAKTGFAEPIIGSAVSIYGFEKLVTKFDRDADAIHFASVVAMRFSEVEIGESELKFLKKLCQKEEQAPGIDIVRGLCENIQEKLSQVMKDIAAKLYKDEPITDCFMAIQKAKTDDFSADIQKVSQNFVDLLSDASKSVVDRTLTFLEQFLDIYSFVAMDALILPLIELTKDEKSYFPPIAERCLITLFRNADMRASICPLIARDADEVMCVIQKYLESANDSEIRSYAKFLPKFILPVFESKSVTVRRAATMSFARFSAVLGEKFEDYVSQLSETNQLLVERFAGRM